MCRKLVARQGRETPCKTHVGEGEIVRKGDIEEPRGEQGRDVRGDMGRIRVRGVKSKNQKWSKFERCTKCLGWRREPESNGDRRQRGRMGNG